MAFQYRFMPEAPALPHDLAQAVALTRGKDVAAGNG
jgi:hypothetical protein